MSEKSEIEVADFSEAEDFDNVWIDEAVSGGVCKICEEELAWTSDSVNLVEIELYAFCCGFEYILTPTIGELHIILPEDMS